MDDIDTLVAALAHAAGVERARAIVAQACTQLGVAYPPPDKDLPRVVTLLSQRPGAVGVAVRLACRRAERRAGQPTEVAKAAAPNVPSPAPPPTPHLFDLLAPALGDEKARTVIRDTAARFGMSGEALSERDELRVLDVLAAGSDYVATVARFAKAKAMLEKKR